MYRRNVESELRSAIADTLVVLLNGARQTGKSTLARDYARVQSIPYVTLDESTQLAAARPMHRDFSPVWEIGRSSKG